MNLKDYSLNEHVKFTEDQLYNKDCTQLRIDVHDGVVTLPCNRHNQYMSHTLNGKSICTMRQSGSTLSICYNNDFYYTKTWCTESFTGINVYYEYDTSKKKIIKKESDFYTFTNIKDNINAYKKNDKNNTSVKVMYSGIHKSYELKNKSSTYTEKYTISSKNLVHSQFSHNYIGIRMSKNVTHNEGEISVSSFIKNINVKFKFEGEPCLLRLLNKTFIFDALISTDLALIIEDVQAAIIDGMKFMQETPTHIKNIDEIVEYYKNNAT